MAIETSICSFENNKNHNNNINKENHKDMNFNRLSDTIVHTLKLPYKGDHGINLIKSIKTHQLKSNCLKNMTLGLF